VQGNYFFELGLWTDVKSAIEDGSHGLIIESGLGDMMGDIMSGFAANVCDVETEHLEGVRDRLLCSMVKDITVAWDSWEGDVESGCQLFAFAAVDDDSRVDVEPAIVFELDEGECGDKERGEKGHWRDYRLLARCIGNNK
jgi:hypothetical protein